MRPCAPGWSWVGYSSILLLLGGGLAAAACCGRCAAAGVAACTWLLYASPLGPGTADLSSICSLLVVRSVAVVLPAALAGCPWLCTVRDAAASFGVPRTGAPA